MPRMRCTRSCEASVPSIAFYALLTIALPYLKAYTSVAKMYCTLGVSEQTGLLRPHKFKGIAALELPGGADGHSPPGALPAHVSPDRTPAERAPCPPCHRLSSIHTQLPAHRERPGDLTHNCETLRPDSGSHHLPFSLFYISPLAYSTLSDSTKASHGIAEQPVRGTDTPLYQALLQFLQAVVLDLDIESLSVDNATVCTAVIH